MENENLSGDTELDNEVLSLEKRLEELRKKQLDIKNAPLFVDILVVDPQKTRVGLKTNKHKKEYHDLITKVHSRRFDPVTKLNYIGFDEYPAAIIAILAQVPNAELTDRAKEKHEEILKLINKPWLLISQDERGDLKLLFKFQIYFPDHFPNNKDNYNVDYRGYVRIPMLASYKLLLDLEQHNDKRIEWSPPELEEKIKAEANTRLTLELIAGETDAPDYDPDLNGNRLLPFQRVVAKFTERALSLQPDVNGILNGCEMGLGKTPTAIAVVERTKGRALVICPATLRENWRRALMKFTQEDPRQYFKTQPSLDDMADLLHKRHRYSIMSYDMLARPITDAFERDGMQVQKDINLWVSTINAADFDYIIIDECHKIKNLDSARTKALLQLELKDKKTKILGLSGTPIINRPKEFYPILSLIDPKNFNSPSQFEAKFTDGKNGARNVTELRRLLMPLMVRKEKKDVFPELPPVIPSNAFVNFTDKQQRLYDTLVDGILTDMETGDVVENNMAVITKLLRLKQFCARVKAEKTADLAVELYDSAESEGLEHKKVIIFSQFVPAVKRIFRYLGHEALYITGGDHNPVERYNISQRFQNDPNIHFIVCSTKATSEGLDMTQAGYVIFNDLMWTPADHDQAIARAYGRIIDMHGVDVRFMVVPNTIEDWIAELLQEKAYTFKQVVSGVNETRVTETSILKEVMAMLRQRGKKK